MWDSVLKKASISYGKNLPSMSSPSMRTKLKPVPTKPKETCMDRFNAIVDYCLDEINRIENGSAPLWNTQIDKPNETYNSFNGYNTWTYYTRSKEDYDSENWFSKALINSEHSNAKAENEEDACFHLKNIAKATVKKERDADGFSGPLVDNSELMEWSLILSTLYMDDDWLLSNRSGAIQLRTDVIDPSNSKFFNSWTPETKQRYLPAINKVLKEHDNMYKKVIQMAKQAVVDLKL